MRDGADRCATGLALEGARIVPISTPLADALETWCATTFYRKHDELVFAHPLHGRPLPEATNAALS
jgi:hypothetical protein